MRILDRYVAVDNVCGWPNLLKLPDETLVITGFNRPNHGQTEGDLDCWQSIDGKGIWMKAGTPGPHKAGQNRMNHAMGITHSGKLIVLVSGWNKGGDPKAKEVNPDGTLQPITAISEDQGVTWSFGTVDVKPVQDRGMVPFGSIVKLKKDVLAVGVYAIKRRKRFTEEELIRAKDPRMLSDAYIIFSYDDGKTWTDFRLIGNDLSETVLYAIDENNVIAVGRTIGNQALDLYRSTDGGKKWSLERAALVGDQRHPADLCRLNDGRILLSYGIRNDIRGIGFRVATSDAITWWEPRLLLEFPIAYDMGYPSSVQLSDGTIVTAYYCDRDIGHTRYHIGTVHWRLD
jgi:hypothetical protein